MAIYKGSRYEYSTVDYFSTSLEKDDNVVVFYEFSQLGLVEYWEHTYIQGERLDQIAYKYYKRPGYWWIIPEYNPSITNLNEITPGTILRIPNV
ncbi:MAG: LysM peptidoglycan-binding domain-containing protein [Paludibacter sp.]|jgi:hypothetical protein